MERRERIEAVFEQARRLHGEARERYLSESCDDPDVRREVDSLLGYHESSGGALDFSPFGADGLERAIPDSMIGRGAQGAPGRGGTARERVGPYRLERVLGEGGFGVVYLALQERPVRRRVAVKVLRSGGRWRPIMARFEAERQALALMNHPGVARVYDAGQTELEEPYFVMEWVDGAAITQFADERRLPVRGRLELFLQVCDAVQHAHQQGIVHRDLKPSNVLVVERPSEPGRGIGGASGAGSVKVIDFGVAKAIGQSLTEMTIQTLDGQFVGTPAYMSPEQAAGRPELVDTRADIYALGVLLFELLTGTTPLDVGALRDAALLDVLRRVREEEAPRPSERVAQGADRARRAAELRGTTSGGLRRALRDDLDWIVLKALEKEREKRYASVSELADDVRRHLAGLPVRAEGAGRMYRAAKFVRRHRVGVAAGVIVVASLGGGLAVALSSAAAEREQRIRAVEAEAQAKAAAAKAETSLAAAAEATRKLIEVVWKLVQDDRGGAYLPIVEECLGLSTKVLGADSYEALVTLNLLGGAYYQRGDYWPTAAHMTELLTRLRARAGDDDPSVLLVAASLADTYLKMRLIDAAGTMWARVAPRLETASGLEGLNRWRVMCNHAGYLQNIGCLEESLPILERVIAEQRASGVERELNVPLIRLASGLRGLGRLEEASRAFERAARIAARVYGKDTVFWLEAELGAAAVMSELGRAAEACERFEAALRIAAEVDAPLGQRAGWWNAYGECLARLGRLAESREWLRGAYDAASAAAPDAAALVARRLSVVCGELGEREEAADWEALAGGP